MLLNNEIKNKKKNVTSRFWFKKLYENNSFERLSIGVTVVQRNSNYHITKYAQRSYNKTTIFLTLNSLLRLRQLNCRIYDRCYFRFSQKKKNRKTKVRYHKIKHSKFPIISYHASFSMFPLTMASILC